MGLGDLLADDFSRVWCGGARTPAEVRVEFLAYQQRFLLSSDHDYLRLPNRL